MLEVIQMGALKRICNNPLWGAITAKNSCAVRCFSWEV